MLADPPSECPPHSPDTYTLRSTQSIQSWKKDQGRNMTLSENIENIELILFTRKEQLDEQLTTFA